VTICDRTAASQVHRGPPVEHWGRWPLEYRGKAAEDIPTIARADYGLVGLTCRTKMLEGSDPCVMAKNGNTAAPLEPSPS
jgi:hypothetical protein